MSGSLQVTVRKQLREIVLEVTDLSVEPGMTLVLGPSGAGKTTLLGTIAGLVRPDDGKIVLDGQVLDDGKHHLTPERREIGFVFQEYALFPHLSVEQNVEYGLLARRVSTAERRRRVDEILERFEIASLARARPDAISGGQRQRVALARALIIRPRALLLDEPMASLDVQTRGRLRAELATLLEGLAIPTLMVTHDEADISAFPSRVVRIDRGSIQT